MKLLKYEVLNIRARRSLAQAAACDTPRGSHGGCSEIAEWGNNQ